MLVLTRKLRETIQIGDDVYLTVISVKGHQVKIGIEAPASVRILRGELAPKETAADQPSQDVVGFPAA